MPPTRATVSFCIAPSLTSGTVRVGVTRWTKAGSGGKWEDSKVSNDLWLFTPGQAHIIQGRVLVICMRQHLIGYDWMVCGFKSLLKSLDSVHQGYREATQEYSPSAFYLEGLGGGLGVGILGNSIQGLAYQNLTIGASKMAQWGRCACCQVS